MDQDSVLYETMKEIKIDNKEQLKILFEHTSILSEIRSDLNYHILRTQQNEDEIKKSNERIGALEEPAKLKSLMFEKFKKWTTVILSSSAVITLAYQLLSYLKIV